MSTKPEQTIRLAELLALSENRRLGRAADALEKIAAAAPRLERVADALEMLNALIARCIGIGSARCSAEGERLGKELPLNDLRTGDGAKPLRATLTTRRAAMSDRATISALNELADTLNEAAAKLDAISRSAVANGLVPHVEPGSPVARMVEQGKRFAGDHAEACRAHEVGAGLMWVIT